jgi:glycogen debranching enzyme
MPEETRPLLIQLNPRGQNLHISQGRTVLISALDGFIRNSEHQGLWVFETRVLSLYVWEVGGGAPTLSALSAVEQHNSLGYYIFAPPECSKRQVPGCDPAQNSIELKIDRRVGDGLIEDVTVTNHTRLESSFVLSLKIGADFASPAEATGRRTQRGSLTKKWQREPTGCSLIFDYKAKHAYWHQGDSGTATFHRGIRLLVTNDQQKPKYGGGRIRFRVKLKPREMWRARLVWTAQVNGQDQPLPGDSTRDQKRRAFLAASARYETAHGGELAPLVIRTVRQAVTDLASLRMYDFDGEDILGERWIPAAGVPMYVALFARDILFCSRQAATLSTSMMRGSLAVLADHLGTRMDDWRDEQPGRVVHGMHSDPLAQLNYMPHSRYFGGVTGSILYGSVVADLWHWTGNRELIAPFLEPALRALAWADKYSRDDSGFYKYKTRSKQGEKNQAWKDSADAIVYPDGSQVADPLGTCEMQGCVYASKLALAGVLWSMDDKESARRLAAEAQELKKRFNELFWLPEEGYLAMGIDSKNRAIRSIASDPGHCLRYGIVDERYRKTIARRLMAKDLFSGWGVRTLSSEHPSFNPFSYHRGSVWPVENGELVMALARCGIYDEMHRLAKASFEVAGLFKYCRLPEVFSGHERQAENPFPGLYPKANSPQAWSASAPLAILQAMLGIQPYAPLQLLLLDPHLPDWLPEITLYGLRVGEAKTSIRFRREASGSTEFEIIEKEGVLRVMRQADPWSMINSFGEKGPT